MNIDALVAAWRRGDKRLGVKAKYTDDQNMAILRIAIEVLGEEKVRAKLLPLCTGYYWRADRERAQTYWRTLFGGAAPGEGGTSTTRKGRRHRRAQRRNRPVDPHLQDKLQSMFS